MNTDITLQPIATIRTDFPDKFGIPRQSCLIDELKGQIIFEEKYRNPEALRGLEGFSHIWLIWAFEGTKRDDFVATVRPPRLGGTQRMGVFATRSPFRPNPIGLSCVRLEGIEKTDNYGYVLNVAGVDLKDNTQILDIKPYIPLADSHPEADSGFVTDNPWQQLTVNISKELAEKVSAEKLPALIKVLECDPRSHNKKGTDKPSGLYFAGMNVTFSVSENILTVISIDAISSE